MGCATGGWLAANLIGGSKWRSCEGEFVLAALDLGPLMGWMLKLGVDWRPVAPPGRHVPAVHRDVHSSSFLVAFVLPTTDGRVWGQQASCHTPSPGLLPLEETTHAP
jgi:hypothetical protein